MKQTRTLRIPRPSGITQMLHEYHATGDSNTLYNAQRILIQQWTLNNGLICGRSFSPDKLAEFIKCDPGRIREHIKENMMMGSKLWDKNAQEEMMNALIGQQLAWAMEDRMDASQQVDILKRAQGGKYAPFITSELNKALTIKQSSGGALNQIFRTLSGGGSVNIFNNITQATQVQNVTMEDALRLIKEENDKLPAAKDTEQLFPKETAYLEAHYDLEEMPEVNAMKQQGFNAEKEGLHINVSKAQISQVIDDYKGALAESDEAHHDIRREIMENIDRDAEDPELDIYPA